MNLGAVDDQKLIHSGKILVNEQTITESGVKPNDVVVVMVSKKKAAAKPATAAVPATPAPATSSQTPATPVPSTPAQPITTSTPQAPTHTATQSVANQPATPAPATATATATATSATASTGLAASAASNVAVGPEQAETIANLMGLGFERDQVVAALRAAFNNPDRAAEYLFSGIPASAGELKCLFFSFVLRLSAGDVTGLFVCLLLFCSCRR